MTSSQPLTTTMWRHLWPRLSYVSVLIVFSLPLIHTLVVASFWPDWTAYDRAHPSQPGAWENPLMILAPLVISGLAALFSLSLLTLGGVLFFECHGERLPRIGAVMYAIGLCHSAQTFLILLFPRLF